MNKRIARLSKVLEGFPEAIVFLERMTAENLEQYGILFLDGRFLLPVTSIVDPCPETRGNRGFAEQLLKHVSYKHLQRRGWGCVRAPRSRAARW